MGSPSGGTERCGVVSAAWADISKEICFDWERRSPVWDKLSWTLNQEFESLSDPAL